MERMVSYEEAQRLLLEQVDPVGKEQIALEHAAGRILAQDIRAEFDVPLFDRSPYDGYAFRAEDSLGASREAPVTLQILEEIPAGGMPHVAVGTGMAVKILTGAPIPPGADAVMMFEKTEYTEKTVTLFSECKSGENIIRAGEDVKKGCILAQRGTRIDAGLAGTIAAQNIPQLSVYRRPVIGIISTGGELLEVGENAQEGKIYNSNRYTLSAQVEKIGCQAVYLGTAGDSEKEIADLIRKGLEICDGMLLTGGVSMGDYDFTAGAMEKAGVKLLFHGVKMKPGMACAYGTWDGKPVCGLSGNPASSLTNYCVIAAQAMKKRCGYREYGLQEIRMALRQGFRKPSPGTRFLRGILDFSDGTVQMTLSQDQGNVVLSSAIGCDAMAVIPAGSGPVPAGTILRGFLL